jgi:hypothetical protein
MAIILFSKIKEMNSVAKAQTTKVLQLINNKKPIKYFEKI